MISHIAPRNLLSFGPENPGIDLKPLNVLIGPNGSGKSNLIEAIDFMRAAPRDFRDVTRKGGGAGEWIWKGNPRGAASMEWVVDYFGRELRHRTSFRAENQFALEEEKIEDAEGKLLFDNWFEPMRPSPDLWDEHRSVLAQRRDPDRYPEGTWMASQYERIRIYREWTFGRNAVIREPQRADMRNGFLEEDFSNLGLVLSRLKTRFPAAKRAIVKGLTDLYEGVSDFDVSVQGGTVQVFFTEGDFSVPATRLSDGTLRYLCLLAILCDPEPPPLICIEEPELGLHPDMIPKLADLLMAASERTQLIVTTHSDILIDALSETPEAVIVCSKTPNGTVMERLDGEQLAGWLERFRLGQLWLRGQIGGTRW